MSDDCDQCGGVGDYYHENVRHRCHPCGGTGLRNPPPRPPPRKTLLDAIAEAARTGQPVTYQDETGKRVVISIPGRDLACPACGEDKDALTAALRAALGEKRRRS